jgi:hypothetical protein
MKPNSELLNTANNTLISATAFSCCRVQRGPYLSCTQSSEKREYRENAFT